MQSAPLDDILSNHLPLVRASRQRPVIVKIDIEGSECNAFATGQSLFTRIRPDFVQVEGLNLRTRACIHEQARLHDYEIGKRFGHDHNTIMARKHRPHDAE